MEAFVQMDYPEVDGRRLSLCKHHYEANADALFRTGWDVKVDDRELLVGKA